MVSTAVFSPAWRRESAGASLAQGRYRLDHRQAMVSSWALLAAEILAVTGKDPQAHYDARS